MDDGFREAGCFMATLFPDLENQARRAPAIAALAH